MRVHRGHFTVFACTLVIDDNGRRGYECSSVILEPVDGSYFKTAEGGESSNTYVKGAEATDVPALEAAEATGVTALEGAE